MVSVRTSGNCSQDGPDFFLRLRLGFGVVRGQLDMKLAAVGAPGVLA